MLAVWLLSIAAGALLLFRLWPWLQVGRRPAVAVAGFFALHAVILADWAATVRIDVDEVTHLHCSWLVSQGLVPFRDFWQNHSPLFWYLLAPVVALFHSPSVFILSRALAGLLFLGMLAATAWLAWKISRSRAAAAPAALIALAFGVRMETVFLRPDQLANLLALISLLLAARLLAGNGVRLRTLALLAGAAFGLTLSLTPKPILAAFAFPLALLIPSLENGGKQRVLAGAYYVLGLMTGLVPLAVLLVRTNLLSRFVFWVFLYHAPAGRVEGSLPAILALVGFAGCAAVWIKHAARPSASLVAAPGSLDASCSPLPGVTTAAPGRLVSIAFLLLSVTPGLYNPTRTPATLMLWVMLAAVLASPILIGWLRPERSSEPENSPAETGASGRVLFKLAIVLLVLIEWEAMLPLLNRSMLGNFASDRARMTWMIHQAGNRPVLLVTPLHSVFSHDTGGLHELYQYSHFLLDPRVNASFSGLANAVISTRPALILANPRRLTDDPETNAIKRPRLFDTLAAAGLLTRAEWETLDQFVRENYSLVEVNGELFYVIKR